MGLGATKKRHCASVAVRGKKPELRQNGPFAIGQDHGVGRTEGDDGERRCRQEAPSVVDEEWTKQCTAQSPTRAISGVSAP